MSRSARVPLGPRLAALACGFTVERARRAAARELRLATTAYHVRRAPRRSGSILVGPFIGEVGFELLYWIPLLRRLLAERGIDASRVTALTRGGAGAWYGGIAASTLDVYELMGPDGLRAGLEERQHASGDQKQLTVEALDRRLIAWAGARVRPSFVVHPLVMYARLRWLWEGRLPLATLDERCSYAPLQLQGADLPAGAALPERYVAVKAYFSDCFPDTEENRAVVGRLISRLTADRDVVLLSTGLSLDDHAEWQGADRVHGVGHLVTPIDNLALQSRIVAGADALVATYGGFSYLGPFLGIPTLALASREESCPRHYEVLRQALPAARYRRVDSADLEAPDAVGAVLEGLSVARGAAVR
jgi:hypothetical protein